MLFIFTAPAEWKECKDKIIMLAVINGYKPFHLDLKNPADQEID